MTDLWNVLRGHGHLWHRTSLASVSGILANHAILPNQGQFPNTFPQSENSSGRVIGAVSLFDFDSAPEAEFEIHRHDYWRGDVFIRIRREALVANNLIRATDMWNDPRLGDLAEDDKSRLVYVPYLEVLYTEAVPETAFAGFVFVPDGASNDGYYEATTLDELRRIAKTRYAEIDREVAARHSRGEYTLAELIAESYREKEVVVP
jgi:hypothetical protein